MRRALLYEDFYEKELNSTSILKNMLLAFYSYLTSITNWWARLIRVKLFVWLKFSEMSCPNV